MKIILTETQLKVTLHKIVEDYYYGKDEYLDDNDLYNYEPSQDEIDRFNMIDLYGKIYNEPEPSKKYSDYAKLYYIYPDGKKALIKRGPIGVIQKLKKNRIDTDKKHANAYKIEFEKI